MRDGGRILDASDAQAIESALEALDEGRLVAIPTDTVYGVAALANEEGVRRLIVAKRRDVQKGIPLLVDSLDQVRTVARVLPAAERLAARYWPGPMTLVLPLRDRRHAPALLTGDRDSVAVRIPDHPVPRGLARALGPLAVSSANLAGEPETRTAQAALDALGTSVAFVLDAGPSPGGVPSTVVELREGEPPRILRQGAVPESEIMATAEG